MISNKLIEYEKPFQRFAENLPEIVCKEFIEILFMNMVPTMNGYNHE